ncbi:MAG: radical SAM protein [Saprospiraceae bacterium]|nr:radical SAM protein [Saprospiraceae bacterium]
MSVNVLLVTPPFTQPNTPYPATAYLKGFLKQQKIGAQQVDLSLETMLALFTNKQLTRVFSLVSGNDLELSENNALIFANRYLYLERIDPVIYFLQNADPTFAHIICAGSYLPTASRFAGLDDQDWAFGNMGIQDRAKHLCTLFLEDLTDFISTTIDPHFGFSRYAEQLSTSLSDFRPIDVELTSGQTFIDEIYLNLLEQSVITNRPALVCLTVPFPGNLFAALKCGQFIKRKYPNIKVAMGGGYCNTELRTVAEERLFSYIDFLCLDDGEAPLLCLVEFLLGKRKSTDLKRTFMMEAGVVQFIDGAAELDVPQRDVGTPDYGDLPIDRYLSMIEVPNPMHRLWSDGFWNKLTLAHGCYWGKCTFCDISLDYISRYEPVSASMICDRISEIISQTGRTGFHFVDEAAPPALLRDLAIALISRKIKITWWTNIRFENRFTPDLCKLLHASGCIAISGGLEVASDRLLGLIKKGVTVGQVARVSQAFTQSGIMVHAYLMYGFPTQTEQETIDSLEMVRQMFDLDIIQSAFWHRFAMTAHSPVGIDPPAFSVQIAGPEFAGFAHNDLDHRDEIGADHAVYGPGLTKSLYNYMQGVGLELPLSEWFDFEVLETTIAPDFLSQVLASSSSEQPSRKDALVIWLGGEVNSFICDSNEEIHACELATINGTLELTVDSNTAKWLDGFLPRIRQHNYKRTQLAELVANLEENTSHLFSDFSRTDSWNGLRNHGLLII